MSVKIRPWKGQRGVWGVFVDHKRQRVAKKVGDRQAAEQVKRDLDEELARRDFKLPDRGLIFKALAEEWIEKYPVTRTTISATTMENYISFTRKHLIPHFDSMPVVDIDYLKLENFIAEKRGPKGSVRFPGKPLSDQSLRVGLVALRLIMDRAVRVHKVLTVNPAMGVARFGQSNKEDKVDPFAPEELRAILAAARELNLAFSVFLRVWAQSGIREGEDSALQNQDLDPVKGTVLVRRTFTRGRLGPTKTRQTRLVSFLHPVTEDTPEWRPGVTAESRRVLAELQALPVRSLEPEAFVFGIKKPWTPAYINAEWRRTLQKAKVRYRPPEQLRHTFASTLLSRGANPLYVQKQGGWRSAAVLYKVYARWIDQGEQAVEGEAEMATLGTGKAQPDATQTQPTRRPVSVNTG